MSHSTSLPEGRENGSSRLVSVKPASCAGRRHAPDNIPPEVFGTIEIDPATRGVHRDGVAVPLTPMEFDLLIALLKRRGSVASRLELLQEVWGHSSAVLTKPSTHTSRSCGVSSRSIHPSRNTS
jgi:DNA-binding response OmpR family regulator